MPRNPAGRRGPNARASVHSRCWVTAVRSSCGAMMLIIICMLAPTHWTRFVCATKSARRPSSRRKSAAAAAGGAVVGRPPSATAKPRSRAASGARPRSDLTGQGYARVRARSRADGPAGSWPRLGLAVPAQAGWPGVGRSEPSRYTPVARSPGGATTAPRTGGRRAAVALAQQAEHRIVAPKVTGSKPVGHPNLPRIDSAVAAGHQRGFGAAAEPGHRDDADERPEGEHGEGEPPAGGVARPEQADQEDRHAGQQEAERGLEGEPREYTGSARPATPGLRRDASGSGPRTRRTIGMRPGANPRVS